MLAMGRAIMSRPKLLLLDEPSMGLAPLMVQKVFETVLAIAGEGVTILLIEQNAKLALEVSNRGYVMESGTITLSGDARAFCRIRRCAQRIWARPSRVAVPAAAIRVVATISNAPDARDRSSTSTDETRAARRPDAAPRRSSPRLRARGR